MSVGEVALRAGISRRAVRLYEAEGLLAPVRSYRANYVYRGAPVMAAPSASIRRREGRFSFRR
jgi:hypothetical protein